MCRGPGSWYTCAQFFLHWYHHRHLCRLHIVCLLKKTTNGAPWLQINLAPQFLFRITIIIIIITMIMIIIKIRYNSVQVEECKEAFTKTCYIQFLPTSTQEAVKVLQHLKSSH